MSELKISHYHIAEVIEETSVDQTLLAFRFGVDGTESLFKLKLLKPQLALGSLLEKIKIEAEQAIKIRHPILSSFVELGFEKGRHFIVCESLDGMTLQSLIAKPAEGTPPLDPKAFMYIALQLSAALSTLEQFQKSRDFELDLIKDAVTPQNIKIGFDGRIKLLEFGAFRTVDNFGSPTPIGSSIFSFGAILWAYFNGQDFEFTRKQFENRVARDLRAFNPKVPQDVGAFVYRCLESGTPSGFSSFVQVRSELELLFAKYASVMTAELLAQTMQRQFPLVNELLQQKKEERRKVFVAKKELAKAREADVPTVVGVEAPNMSDSFVDHFNLPEDSTRRFILKQFNVMNLMRTMMATGVLFVLGALWVSLAQRPGAMEAYKPSGLIKTTHYYFSVFTQDLKNRITGYDSRQKRAPASVHKVVLMSTPRTVRVEINGEESFDTITPTKIDFPPGETLWLKIEAEGVTPMSIIVNKQTKKIIVDLKNGTHKLE